MSKSLIKWLSAKHGERIMKLSREHFERVVSCGMLFIDISKAWKDNELDKIPRFVDLIIEEEHTADNIRDEIIDELIASEMPTKARTQLIQVVQMADRVAGRVKRGAKNVKILHLETIPSPIIEKLHEMIKVLSSEIEYTADTMAHLSNNRDTVLKLIKKAEDAETKLDKEYYEMKCLFIKEGKTIGNPGTLVILDHLVQNIEHAADLCEDTAEMLKFLITIEA